MPPSDVESVMTEDAPDEPLQPITEKDDHEMEKEDDDDDLGSLFETEAGTTESEHELDEKEKSGYITIPCRKSGKYLILLSSCITVSREQKSC